MNHKSLVPWSIVAGFLAALFVQTVTAEQRTWTDTTGKFSITAEFAGMRGDKAVLRMSNGKEATVALDQLSAADREFIKTQPAKAVPREAKPTDTAGDADKNKRAAAAISELAELFFADLRTTDRLVARESLTAKAESLMKGGKSPLAALPQPETGSKGIKIGKSKVEGTMAEVPVLVRADNQLHRTTLHLRLEDDVWQVFALSAIYADGEKSINFEAEAAPAGGAHAEPLQALVGKPVQIDGYTLEGKPVSSADFKNKVVLIDFWATWCGPCRAEIPNIAANWARYHDAGFEVMAVSVDDDLQALRAFTAEEKPPWTVIADNHPLNKKSMGAKFGINAIPAFILIGPDGKVAAVNCRGPLLGQALDQILAGDVRNSRAAANTLR